MAFDIAPYALLDQCLLLPLREKLAGMEQHRLELAAANQAAQWEFDSASASKAHTLMVLADRESRALEESILLRATREIDTQWDQKLKQAKQQLSSLQSEYKKYRHLLDDEEEALAATWRDEIQRAQDDKAQANRRLAEARDLVERTERDLEHKQQALDHQCGLLETAREFPNDADIQSWVLSSICELTRQLAGETEGAATDCLDAERFLFRQETVSVILDAAMRFPRDHHVQTLALTCLVELTRSSKENGRAARSLPTSSDQQPPSPAQQFGTLLLESNTLAVIRDVLIRYQQNLDVFQKAFEIIYCVFSTPGATKQTLQFCQHKQSQLFPVQFLQLLHAQHSLSENGSTNPASRLPQFSTSHCHIAHFLFTLAKYNVKKPLLNAGIVPMILRQIGEVAASAQMVVGFSNAETSQTEDIALTVQFFLATLAILHSIASPSEQVKSRDNTLPLESTWAEFHVGVFIDSMHIFLDAEALSSDQGAKRASFEGVVYWMLKLLRNLVWHPGIQAGRIRADLESHSTFRVVTNAVLATKRMAFPNDSVSQASRTNIANAGLELLRSVWICRYDEEGRLLSVPHHVLDYLLDMMRAETNHIYMAPNQELVLVELGTLLETVALVMSNGKRAYSVSLPSTRHVVFYSYLPSSLWLAS